MLVVSYFRLTRSARGVFFVVFDKGDLSFPACRLTESMGRGTNRGFPNDSGMFKFNKRVSKCLRGESNKLICLRLSFNFSLTGGVGGATHKNLTDNLGIIC